MKSTKLMEWCANYKRAWEMQDTDLFVSLFTRDCLYRDTPFSEPIHASAFREFWDNLTTYQRDNRIEFEVLGGAGEGRYAVQWRATSATRYSDNVREGSGIMLLTFDDAGLCSDLAEWQHWHTVGAPLERHKAVPL